jgi:predicted O-linked N-acetylglucosamine transferase (SPINDLY family)
LPNADQLRAAARAHLADQRFPEAVETYRGLVALHPDDPALRSALAYALRSANQPEAAKEQLKCAISLDPALGEPHYMLAEILREEGQAQSAALHLEAAISCQASFNFAYPDLVDLLVQSGANDAAKAVCREALVVLPGSVRLHLLAGNVASLDQDDSTALAQYNEALQLAANDVDARIGQGLALIRLGRREEGLASFRAAIEADPARADSRWALVMALLPQDAGSAPCTSSSGADFLAALKDFEGWSVAARFDESQIVGSYLPFMLAYREENHRALLAAYGATCVRMMSRWQTRQHWAGQGSARRPARAKLRIGIASPFFSSHSVWHALLKGWVNSIDRERFELVAFHLSASEDHETEVARAKVSAFHGGKRSIEAWPETIAMAQLDALIYGSIGMDQLSSQLACLRLAPVQATTWGHPETSGLPTLDFYLSAALLEPAGAQEAYSEKLVLLDNLGVYYEPTASDPSQAIDLAQLGIDDGRPILICPGSPFKYAAIHDSMLVDLALRLPGAQLVFFRSQFKSLSAAFEQRLAQRFEEAGLTLAEHCCFVPWMDTSSFHSLMRRADVFVDTVGFSGFNTASQAIECGLPVATVDGAFMRGRLASGILKRLDLEDLIVATPDALVGLVARLVEDHAFAQSMRALIEARRARLFRDQSATRALETFLERATAGQRTGGESC